MANGGVAHNGYQLLKSETIDLMRTNRMTGHLKDCYDREMTATGYGYGLGVRTLADKSVMDIKTPVGEFGWGGAAGTYVVLDPENNTAIFYAQQVFNTPYNDYHDHPHNYIRDTFYSIENGETV